MDKDIEFRYAVAGYLGLSEILKRLDSLTEEQVRLREEQTKIWKEIEALKEEQVRLREEQTKLGEEQTKLREEQTKLREDFNKMLEVIKQLQEGQIRLEKRVDSLEAAMISGFGELSKFAGLTFEEFVRKFLTASMRKSGDIPEYAELVKGFVDSEEVNLFLEEPLIIGETTSYAESTDDIQKLLRKAEVAKAKYSREPKKILVILAAKREAAKEIRKVAEEKNVEIIIGKIVD
ncbi:MAG: hypothetical protein FGF48_08965 [Candidatus Brockarchaeota archaeon]|nr:hypothetical protein [Candidatus Brockarchaeota archaeon]